jgi:uncharacterized protein (TIGR01777 family)
MSRRVIITGGTGLIGRALTTRLLEAGFEVAVLTRGESAERRWNGRPARFVHWNAKDSNGWLEAADGAYGIVNLAGYGIASGRWRPHVKRTILESRLQAGRAVCEAVRLSDRKPEVVVQASAIGYYGSRGEDQLDESSAKGRGFLADVAKLWEESTAEVESLGTRRAVVRTALVLARDAEFIRRISLPFKLFVGGPQGGSRLWVSWIHLDDEARAITFLLERSDLSGTFNLASPNPVRNGELARALGRAIRRPALFGTPAFLLRVALGEMADELLLASQRVIPKRLLDAGFDFAHADVGAAFEEIFARAGGGTAER